VLDRPLPEVLASEEILSFLGQHRDSQSPGSMETTFPESAPHEVFQVTLTPMRDEEGTVVGKMISARDITREKSSEKAQQEFLDSIAHEFLTPLTTIKSYNEMLMDGEVEDAEVKKDFYNVISEQTNRLGRLIQNLLNLSKIEMGTMTPNNGLVKTDLLIASSISTVEPNALKRNITIKQDLPDQFPSLIGDKDLLQTAIINILGNAVKYSPKDTEITFSLHEENKLVVFDVVDQGFGISEEDLPHVFDRFYRSKDPNVVEQTGSGLGLAMTLEIIQLHGGEVEVQSELGKGTHFSIRIPKEEYFLGKE
jgi:signal transduction histidine kinase